MTRAIKRICKFITEQTQTKRRLEKEIEELRKDFHMACELHVELYVNPTSLSNHHEKNTVHEEHPPVAENTPPPPAGDDDLNAKYFL